jgi:hypothetical protein
MSTAPVRRKVRPWLNGHGWLLIGALWVGAVVLGYLGFRALEGGRSFWDTLYLSLQLFPLQSGAVPPPVPWQLEVARFLAPAVLAATAVGAVLALLHEQLESLSVRRLRGHVVVCGLGERGLLLAKALSRDHRVVAIDDDETARGVGEAREAGVIVMLGDATDSTVLRKAGARRARYLVAVGGDDGMNAEIAVDSRELLDGTDGDLTAFVHVVDPKLCALLREQHLRAEGRGSFRLRFFNVYEAGARAWLAEHPPFAAGHAPHLVVVGAGQVGASLVVGAARSWLTRHPETALHPESSSVPRITIVDRAATEKRALLVARTPGLREFCDLEACEIDVTSADYERADFLFDAEGRCTATAVYVCLDDDSRGLTAALTLARRLEGVRPPVPVVVRMRRESGLAGLLDGVEDATALRAFPLLDRTCTAELLLDRTTEEILAREAHERYVRQELEAGVTQETNPSLVGWDELPESLKESNRRQAAHIAVKLAAVGCTSAPLNGADGVVLSRDEVEQLARMEHERWLAERLFECWAPAPTKDLKEQKSPTLLPWDELSPEERRKDLDAVRDLPGLLARAGLRIRRVPALTNREDDHG